MREVEIIDFHDEDDGIVYCQRCEEYGFKNNLQSKLLMPGEEKQPDYESWLQCHTCGTVYPVYEAKFESNIKDFVEVSTNPFDEEKGQVLGVDNRATERRKGKKRKSRFSTEEHEDPEIQAAIDKGLAVNILYDSRKKT